MSQSAEEEEEFRIIVEGKTLTSSKNLLREKSEYFRAMFDSSMIENKENIVTLHDQEYSVVSDIVDFIKTRELKIKCGARNMRKLTEASVMFQVKDAIESCTAFWKETLCHDTCLSLMTYSKSLNLEDLYSCAKRHALYYFIEVIKSTDYLQLDAKDLLEYLCSQDLNINSEVKILDAILCWYNFDKPARKQHLKEFVPCFHSEDVQKDSWNSVKEHELVRESEEWQAFIDKVTRADHDTKNEEKFRRLPVIFLSVGGYDVDKNSEKPCTDICKFDDTTDTFQPLLDLRDVYPQVGDKMGYQVTVVGKDLYLSGGQLVMTRYSMITDVWKLDGFDLKWEKVTKLTSPRRHHGACGAESSLFIMGGFGKYRDILDTVQKYDTVNDTWTDLPKMPHTWFTPQAVYCDNKIYVYKTSLISLDLDTLEWTTIRETSCSIDNTYTFFPLFFEGYIYEFPYFDNEIEWFYEFEIPKIILRKMNIVTQKLENIDFSNSIQFGNKCAMSNGKFYVINRYDKEFVSCDIHDFSVCKKIGSQGKAGMDCTIVALPHYPVYKIRM